MCTMSLTLIICPEAGTSQMTVSLYATKNAHAYCAMICYLADVWVQQHLGNNGKFILFSSILDGMVLVQANHFFF